MIRFLLLASAMCLASADAATLDLNIQVTGGTTAGCRATTANDGCSAATPGTIQNASLFAAYPNRPAWNVAGVDYATGPASGTMFKDPTTSLPSGCSLSGSNVTCSGSPTLVGYDFATKHLSLTLNGGGTVTDSKFQSVSGNCRDPMVRTSGTLTFIRNDLDNGWGVCSPGSFGTAMFSSIGGGQKLTIQYNYIHSIPQDAIDIIGSGSSAASVDIRYNYMDTLGKSTVHADGIQFTRGTINPVLIEFNTLSLNKTGTWTQPLHVEAQLNGTIANTSLDHNTVTAYDGQSCSSNGYPNNCQANYLISCKNDSNSSETDSNTNFYAYANYLDARGSLSAWSNNYQCGSQAHWGTAPDGSSQPNINLTTGAHL